MKKNCKGKALICFVVVFLLILPTIVQAEKQKIRVVVENSTIRVDPDIQSEIIKKPPIGSVFNVEKKVGEWYEIKVLTELGFQVTGYISEMFVELEKEEKKPLETKREIPKEPEKQVPPATFPKAQKTPATRGEFAIRGAYTTGYSVNDLSYSDSFSAGVLQNATSTGNVTLELEKPFGFDSSFNYFLTGGLGIQLRFDYNAKSNFTDASESTFGLNYSWTSGGSYTTEEKWSVEGDVTLMIISGNLIYKVQGAGIFAPFFSGGASYYSGNIKASTTGAIATTWLSYPYRYVDYFDIPASLDSPFSGIGFNVGGGIDIRFSNNIGFTVDARYFVLKKVEENWEINPGKYDSNLHDGWQLTVNDELINTLQEGIGLFELNPSFFKVSAGVKIMF